MKLKGKGISISIDDNSEEGKKIKAGYNYKIEKGNIKILKAGTDITNKYQAIKALKESKNLKELKEILIKFLEIN